MLIRCLPFLTVLWAFPLFLAAQSIVVEEDFEDEDLTQNPEWTGDPDNFTFVKAYENTLLRLDADEEGSSQLRTPMDEAYGTWEFFIDQDFSPSANNRGFIFLTSDSDDLSGDVNGYAVRTGEGGTPKHFRLYRFTDGNSTEILTGELDLTGGGPFQVRVTRENDGTWALYESEGYGSVPRFTGEAVDDEHTASDYFGIRLHYTSTRTEEFFFDNIIIRDGILPLKLSGINTVSPTELNVIFTEPVEAASIDPSDFSVNGTTPQSAQLSENRDEVVELNFAEELPSGNYTLTVNNIRDFRGNEIEADTEMDFILYGEFEQGDILINEFFYRVPIAWRTSEFDRPRYIELYNQSDKILNLRNWSFNNQNFSVDSDLAIHPDEYFVVTRGTPVFENRIGERDYFEADNFPTLPLTTESEIVLRDAGGATADSLYYIASQWGGNEVALERLSLEGPTHLVDNWAESEDPLLGTPGLPNSVEAPDDPPEITRAGFIDAQTAEIQFNRAILQDEADDPSQYSISGVHSITDIAFANSETVQLMLDQEMESGTEYSVTAQDIMDIFSNVLQEGEASFTYYEFEAAEPGDILINEFFYRVPDDWRTDENDRPQYIEIINTSDKFINLQDWVLRRSTTTAHVISDANVAIEPDELLVLNNDTPLFEEIYGAQNFFETSSFPRFLIGSTSSDQIRIFNDEGKIMDSLRYDVPTWGGQGIALERISTDIPAHIRDNWEESPSPDLGTPGGPNLAEPDDDPPEFTDLRALHADTILVEFSESVTENSAGDENNYHISGAGDPQITELRLSDDATAVTIALDPAMEDLQTYTVTISGVEDIFGNTAPETSREVTWYEVQPADPDEVFLNEFMYDPPGLSEAYTRYFELYNTADHAIDVAGWTQNNDARNPTEITETRTIVPPDSFLVVAEEPELENLFPDINMVHMSGFQALKSGGDDLVIRSSEGSLIDSLSYEPAWGGAEVALERRTTQLPAYLRDNWADSPAAEFGTPGRANAVTVPEEPAEVAFVEAPTAERVRIVFTRSLAEESAVIAGHYQISGGVTISSVEYREAEVILSLDQPLVSEQTYELTLSGLEDIFGNALPQQTHEFTYLEYETAEQRDVVINEFLYRPGGEEGVTRFVELYNRSDKAIDLDGWILERGTGQTTALRGSESPAGDRQPIDLPAGEYMVITADDSWVSEQAELVHTVSNMLSLSSLGDVIAVRNEDATTVDTLRYAPSWGGNQEGTSVERLDPEAASNDPGNWATNTEGHTAGYSNENYEPDEVPPELTFTGVRENGTLRVYFDQHIRLGGEAETRFAIDGRELEVIRFDRHNANTLVLQEPESLPSDEDAELMASELTDVAGNVNPQLSIPVARPLEEEAIVINEIMYQPISDRYTERPDQSEYLEFYNRRPYAVSLEGVYIHDEPDAQDETSDIRPASTTGKWIPAEGFAVMHGDPAQEFGQTRLARFFGLQDGRHVLRADRSSLSLPNRENEVNLADSNDVVIDRVRYNPGWHNQNLADVSGRALERKRPSGESNDARNWSTTTNDDGGTPLVQNTIFSEPEVLPEEEGITLTPDPFAPNADGQKENLNIAWKLEEPDYLMRIRIYDRHGRMVRELADGEQAGLEGTVTWDGMKNDGTDNRAGFYIILFEAYNSANGSNRTFKETAVLARDM